jgi:nicotinate dehydrogenase subunit B
MRADEHGWDPKGPPTLVDLRAGFDQDGEVVAWESELFIPDGTVDFVNLVGADLAGLNSLGRLSPGGVIDDLAIPYGFPKVKTTAHRLESTPLKPSWIRSPDARRIPCQRILPRWHGGSNRPRPLGASPETS